MGNGPDPEYHANHTKALSPQKLQRIKEKLKGRGNSGKINNIPNQVHTRRFTVLDQPRLDVSDSKTIFDIKDTEFSKIANPMNFSSRTNTVGSPYESERRKISEEANEHKCNVDRIDNDINKLNTTYQKVVENDIPNPEIHSNIPKSSGCNLVIKGDSHIFQSVNIAKQHTNESSPKFNNNFEEKVDKIQKSDEVKEPQSPEIRRDRHPKMFHVVKKAFDFYDKDRSGKLEISEIGELLYDICSSMGHFFSDEKLEKCHQI